MPQVIDALVVELGLDPTMFTQGQKDAMEAFKKTQEEAKKGGDALESQGKKITEVFGGLKRGAIEILGAFFAGRGIKEFVAHITALDASTGRVAKTLNMGAKEVSAWQGAFEATGGSAAGATSQLQSLSSAMNTFMLTGQGPFLALFTNLGLSLFDDNKQLKTAGAMLLDIAAAVEKVSRSDPARAAALLQMIPGATQESINVLIQGEARVRGLVDAASRAGGTTKESAEEAQRLQERWALATRRAEELGRVITEKLGPAMRALIGVGSFVLDLAGNLFFGTPMLKGDGVPPSPSSGPAPSNVRAKSGAGSASLAVDLLARELQNNIPGIDRFTAFDDDYHRGLGRPSAHSRGQALDFTMKNKADAAIAARMARLRLSAFGIDATVIDEYANPSAGSTGGHVHVQFNSADAAARYASIYGGGAGSAAQIHRGGDVNSRSTQVSINKIEVNAPRATDADGIANGIAEAMMRATIVAQINNGLR